MPHRMPARVTGGARGGARPAEASRASRRVATEHQTSVWRKLHAAGRAVAIALLLAGQAACATVAPSTAPLENLSEVKHALTRYHDDGAYAHDLAAALAPARAWIAQRAPQVSRPAIVLDIDDTALSSWPELKANDYGFIPDGPCDNLPHGPCGWHGWVRLAQAPAIAPTLQLYRQARALHVAVFFVSGRHEAARPATERNLRAAGFDGWRHLYMEPDGFHVRSAADFKAPVRGEIETAGYTIIANIGDQPSDLAGGHAERSFLLPNPFYRVP